MVEQLFEVVVVVDTLAAVARAGGAFAVRGFLEEQPPRPQALRHTAVALAADRAVEHDPRSRQEGAVVVAVDVGGQQHVPARPQPVQPGQPLALHRGMPVANEEYVYISWSI